MDLNFVLFNIHDVFRAADSLVDKIKAVVVMNWNQKSIKLLVQKIYYLAEDEPGNISIYKVKMLKSGASYLNNAMVNKILDDIVAADTNKN